MKHNLRSIADLHVGCAMKAMVFILSLLFCGLAYGKGLSVEQRDSARRELNQQAEEIIAAVIANDPGVQEEIDSSVGIMTGAAIAAKSLLLGGGYGEGVIFDKGQDSRTYINLARLELGVGVGAGELRYLVVFQDRSAMMEFKRGVWRPSLGSEAVIGGQEQISSQEDDKGFRNYVLTDSGANASLTIRLLRVTINRELTDTGVGNTGMPMKGFDDRGRQVDDAPRTWGHSLPFGAQKVLDKGYDLPLPFGVSLLYAYIEQDQVLDSLQGGLNGGELTTFDFVTFENAESKTDSLQLKFDAWLLPFLNLYATVGYTDIDAPLDVYLDGDGMLDYLDINCDKVVVNPLCKPFEGQTVFLPIVAHPSGMTYSVGTVLAGGWNGYFATIPVNWALVDLDGRETEGKVFTITPRVGKILDLDGYGTLALFAGGNYLDTELTVSGSYDFPGGLVTIDYVIDQKNKDKWNGVVGGNWEINRNWSLLMEYNGFFGSRDAFVSALTWRY